MKDAPSLNVRIRLTRYKYNERSRRLFTRVGFVETGQGKDNNGVDFRSYMYSL